MHAVQGSCENVCTRWGGVWEATVPGSHLKRVAVKRLAAAYDAPPRGLALPRVWVAAATRVGSGLPVGEDGLSVCEAGPQLQQRARVACAAMIRCVCVWVVGVSPVGCVACSARWALGAQRVLPSARDD